MFFTFFNGVYPGAVETDVNIRVVGAVVNRFSHVLITISEVNPLPGQPNLDNPVLGGATMRVNNVCPHDDNTITVRLSNNFNADVNYRL